MIISRKVLPSKSRMHTNYPCYSMKQITGGEARSSPSGRFYYSNTKYMFTYKQEGWNHIFCLPNLLSSISIKGICSWDGNRERWYVKRELTTEVVSWKYFLVSRHFQNYGANKREFSCRTCTVRQTSFYLCKLKVRYGICFHFGRSQKAM